MRTEQEKKDYQRKYQKARRDNMTPEEREKKRQYQREYYLKKKAAEGKPPKPKLTDEERKARRKEYNAKYWREHKAELTEKRSSEEGRAKERARSRRRYNAFTKEEKQEYIKKHVEYNRKYRAQKRASLTTEDLARQEEEKRIAKIERLKEQLVALGVPEIKEITWSDGKPPLNNAGISDDYMLSLVDGTIAFGAYSSHSDSWSDADGNIYGKDLPRVTAWREIPEPYAE